MFLNSNNERINLEGLYEGAAVFLFGGGRSITPQHIELGRRPGIITAAVNEGGHYIRPNLYMSTSGITMPQSVLKDPTVMKFVNSRHWNKPLFEDRSRGKWILEYPNVVGMKMLTSHFGDFMNKDYIYQQEQKSGKYAKNSAITFINVLVKLGFKKIYLVGMDFYDSTDSCTYFYEREYINAIKGNLIDKVKGSLKQLLTINEVQIFNTNPRSGLDFFRFAKLEDAIAKHETYYKHDICNDFTAERAAWGWKEYLNIDKSHIVKK